MKIIQPKCTGRKFRPRTFALLIAAVGLLALPGCQNPFDSPEDANRHGTFTLTVVGHDAAARTIAPDWSAAANVDRIYSLAFTPGAGNHNAAVTVDNWIHGDPVALPAGLWNMVVYVYRTVVSPANRIARGAIYDINVLPGGGASGSVALAPVGTGTGTFDWSIAVPGTIGIYEATLELYRVSDGQPVDSRNLTVASGTIAGTHDLPAGVYRVIFRLANAGGERATISEVLHIHPNLTSYFSVTNLPAHFPASLLNIILEAVASTSGTVQGNLYAAGIRHGHFGLLNIAGVNHANFDNVVEQFGSIVAAAPAPTNEGGLKALVDAALIRIAAANPAFIRANFSWDEDEAEGSITGTAVNVALAPASFSWTGPYTVAVTVGHYTVNVVFVPAPVERVVISGLTSQRLEETYTLVLSAVPEPYDARYRGIGWQIPTAAHSNLVEISDINVDAGTATVTGLAAGLANVRAYAVSDPGRTAYVEIDVFPLGAGVPITGITIDNGNITLQVGEHEGLAVTRTPSYTTQTRFFYASSDDAVATIALVDGTLRVTAVSVGTATITVAAYANLDVYDTITVTVTYATPTGVSINAYAPTMVRGGDPQTFTVTVEPPGARQAVYWSVVPEPAGSTSDVSISPAPPAVSRDGVLTIGDTVTHGTRLIVTATVPGTTHTATATITVIGPPTGITIDQQAETMVRGGESRAFTVTAQPQGAYPYVTWSVPGAVGSFVGNVLTILPDAPLGNVQITATTTFPGSTITANATVTVVSPVPYRVHIDPPNRTIVRGTEPESFVFTANMVPQAGVPGMIDNRVVWSVYPPGVAGVSIAPVGLTATVTVNPATLAVGTFNVIALAYGHPGVSGTATVNIREPGNFEINLPGFPDVDINIPALRVELLNPPVTIQITGTFDPGSIRWFFAGHEIDADPANGIFASNNGQTLTLGPKFRGNLLEVGDHFMTLEVAVNGVPRSVRVGFTVMP